MQIGFSEQSFNYQIDILVPGADTSFSDLKSYFLNDYKFFMLTRIRLDELLETNFKDKFLTNGEIYLQSFNTRLDCHDCVCLLPNGNLILHLTDSSYRRIPINLNKKTIKSTGFDKYEIQFNLFELKDNDNERLDLFKSIFVHFEFSFYAHWNPSKESKDNTKNEMETFFGSNRVAACLNRIESNIVECSQITLDLMLKQEFNSTNCENYLDFEKLTGCLINNVKPELLFDPSVFENCKKNKSVSILRIKGFMPNKILNDVLRPHVKSIFDINEDLEKVFIKLHGFRDSPTCLYNLDHSYNSKIRLNYENFYTICFDKNMKTCFEIFNDFENIFLIRKKLN